MGKKWNDNTRILFEKKRELKIPRLTIAHCKQYTNNPYQLVYNGKHVGFFPSWQEAFYVIDDVVKFGIEETRKKYKRIEKNLLIDGDQLQCYRCELFKDKSSFKWGHKYCKECALNQKKEYYYINKYEISNNKYSSFRKYFSGLLNKRNRKSYFSLDDIMNLLEKQEFKCAITRQDFILEKNNPKLPSIDRINPKFNGGEYELENIQIIWHGLNTFKNKWSMEFLKECAIHIMNYY